MAERTPGLVASDAAMTSPTWPSGLGHQDLGDLARGRDHRVVAGLDVVERPLAIVAQPLGELVEGAHRRLAAVDVRALQLVTAGSGQRLLERLERLRPQMLAEPL